MISVMGMSVCFFFMRQRVVKRDVYFDRVLEFW